MKLYAGVILAGSLIIAGCSEEKPVPPPAPVNPAPAVGAQPVTSPVAPPPVSAPAATPAAPPPGTAAITPAATAKIPGLIDNVDKDYVHHLLNLNNAYQGFRSIEMRSPRDLNELVTSKRIDQLPPAPPGKMYKIDEPNLRVILVNQ
jgi:hypothetical protein